jgi:hypothetical protein
MSPNGCSKKAVALSPELTGHMDSIHYPILFVKRN